MSRNTALCTVSLLLFTPLIALPQTRDGQIEELKKETAQLKTIVADQGRRIAELEKTVQALRAAATPTPTPIPSPTPPWHSPRAWVQIKPGMSEAQVVAILGPPTNVDASIDVRTLLYEPDSRSTSTLRGSVTLLDDRVTAMNPPSFPR